MFVEVPADTKAQTRNAQLVALSEQILVACNGEGLEDSTLRAPRAEAETCGMDDDRQIGLQPMREKLTELGLTNDGSRARRKPPPSPLLNMPALDPEPNSRSQEVWE